MKICCKIRAKMTFPRIFNLDNKTNLYLSNCDFINKSLLNSVLLKPRLDKIVLSLCLNKPDENLIPFNSNEKVESFLSLYLLNLRNPLLVINNDQRISIKFFKLKVLLSERSEIDLFLSCFFNESKNEFPTENYLKEELNRLNSILIDNETCTSLTTKISIGSFFEVSNFLDENYLPSKLKKLKMKIDFYFKGCKYKTRNSVKNLIKNVPLFWISC